MPDFNSRQLRSAWWGTFSLFLAHGLIVGTWVSRIPAIQAALHLNNGVLGLTLLSSAVGAVLTMPLTGRLVSRVGSKSSSAVSSIAFCLALNLPALARNATDLSAALFIYGVAGSAMGISMNTQGVEVEKALGKPTMSRFHAMFSWGAMTGSALGGWAAARTIEPATHFLATSIILLASVLAVSRGLLPVCETARHREHRLPLNRIPKLLLVLSAIAFCILLTEGAMADWIAIYLRQILRASAGLAAEGYATFAAAMAIFRLTGDLITACWGPYRTVRNGSILAACGLMWAMTAKGSLWAFPGFAVTGAGLSVIIPLVFGGGGRVESVSPGAGIATVTGLGYLGFIVGPPAIGFTSQLVTLRYALGLVVACCLISAVLSRSMRSLSLPAHAGPVPEAL